MINHSCDQPLLCSSTLGDNPQVIILLKSFQLLSSSCNLCNLVLSCFVNVRRFLQTWLNCVCDVMQGQQQQKLNLRLLSRLLNLFPVASQFYFYQTAANFAKCRSCGFAQSAQTLRFASCPESCCPASCPTHISACAAWQHKPQHDF